MGVIQGRMYDYNNGRFLSVDPFIQSPTSTQSMNPYTYIFNNPLSGTDPTGYQKEDETSTVVTEPVAGGFTKSRKVAPIGSNIKSSTTVSGQAQNGSSFSVTVDKNGQIAGSSGLDKIGVKGAVTAVNASQGSGATKSSEVGARQGQFAKSTSVPAENVNGANRKKKNSDIVVAFDGAGSDDFPDNVAISDLAEDLNAKLFNSRGGLVKSPVGKALKHIVMQLKDDPNAEIYIFGYSAGGHDAIKLTQKLAKKGITVSGLVTFDPHFGKKPFGYTNYNLTSNIASAINFTQQNKAGLGNGNPFLGGIASCGTCSNDPNVNFTGTSVIHTDIVRHSIRNYRDQIYKTLGR